MSNKITLSAVRSYLGIPGAIDCNNHGTDEYRAVMAREKWLDDVAYSRGVNGLSGLVLQGHESGNYYVISCRSSALFIYA